jgi:hypothetical protein
MKKHIGLTIAFLLLLAGPASANDDLKANLKKLSKTIDELALVIADQRTLADCETYSRMTKLELENSFADSVVQVKAAPGACFIFLYTPSWQIRSYARDGRIVESKIDIR